MRSNHCADADDPPAYCRQAGGCAMMDANTDLNFV
jgi:hypothetical protein